MQYYKVTVRLGLVEGLDYVYEQVVYTDVYSGSAKDAVDSVVVQKKVKREDIIGVQTDVPY
jgi:hypothetical protein